MFTLKNLFWVACILFSVFLNPISLCAHGTILATNISNHNQEQHIDGHRADAHAPITIMGEHTHKKGEWMLSYRYMQMRMSGSRNGHHSLSNADVLADFMITPVDMTMQMHMLGAMYAPSDKVTLMLMAPFIRNDMDHRNRAGLTFRTHSSGIGDLKLSGLVTIYEKERHRFHLNLGLSLPTGSIDEKHDLPIGKDRRLPYPMQLGSGTWDLLPGITYNGQSDHWSWGAQTLATVRPGRNHVGYSLGNKYETTFWFARKWCRAISQSIGLKHTIWQNIGGRDPLQMPGLVPTAAPDSRGGKRLDLLFGVNLYVPKGLLKGHRLALDIGIPVMQSLDGPQLETDWYFTAGWQKSF